MYICIFILYRRSPGPALKVSMWVQGPIGPMGPNGTRAQLGQWAQICLVERCFPFLHGCPFGESIFRNHTFWQALFQSFAVDPFGGIQFHFSGSPITFEICIIPVQHFGLNFEGTHNYPSVIHVTYTMLLQCMCMLQSQVNHMSSNTEADAVSIAANALCPRIMLRTRRLNNCSVRDSSKTPN